MEKRRAVGEEQEVGRERANYGLCGGAGGEGAEESDQWQRRRAMRKESIVKRTQSKHVGKAEGRRRKSLEHPCAQSKHLGKVAQRPRKILDHPCRVAGGVAGALSGCSFFNII